MLADIVITILLIASTFYMTIVLLRFLLQLARADFYNPISQFVVKATNPPLRPLRRFIPGWGGIDGAALVLAVIIQIPIPIRDRAITIARSRSVQNPIIALRFSISTISIGYRCGIISKSIDRQDQDHTQTQ